MLGNQNDSLPSSAHALCNGPQGMQGLNVILTPADQAVDKVGRRLRKGVKQVPECCTQKVHFHIGTEPLAKAGKCNETSVQPLPDHYVS